AEAEAPRVTNQREEGAAFEGVAAGEDEMGQRVPEAREVVEEPEALGGRQLVPVRRRERVGAAVAADERARARRLPVHAPGRAVEDESCGAHDARAVGVSATMTMVTFTAMSRAPSWRLSIVIASPTSTKTGSSGPSTHAPTKSQATSLRKANVNRVSGMTSTVRRLVCVTPA